MDTELNPLINDLGRELLSNMLQSPHAPIFNHRAGDRINNEDLLSLSDFREKLRGPAMSTPDLALLTKIGRWRQTVPLYRETIPSGSAWEDWPTVSRADIAGHAERLVPDDQELSRLIVYRTAGTTGHPLLVPHHPRAAAAYQIFIEEALRRSGISCEFGPGRAACFLLGAQKSTVTYPTVLSAWNQAGFVKLNLNPTEWRDPSDRQKFFDQFLPEILTGDPISFAEMLSLGLRTKAKAFFSTAVAMSPSLKKQLQETYGAPVIDWYSLTETGPIGFVKPDEDAYTILPTDLYVEILDSRGKPVPEGDTGEITVSGGRNPFVPLIRYRTGDYGSRRGDRIHGLEGRSPVIFRSKNGKPVNPVDVARVLREFPIVQHVFKQKPDLSCEVKLRTFSVGKPLDTVKLEKELADLFEGLKVSVTIDPSLGDRLGKVMAYESEVRFEE